MIALRALIGVLTFGITIPIWVILAAGIWFQFDKTSSVRRAVDRAVTELVVGAELEAARERSRALEQIVSELRGRAAALEAANNRFSTSLQKAQTDLENANDQLIELLARPVNDDCVVDPSVLERLRSK